MTTDPNARKTRAPMPGFSGSSPYEICMLYAAGDINRARTVDELARWDFAPIPKVEPADDLGAIVPGSTQDVEHAVFRGLIDLDLYAEVFDRWEAMAANPACDFEVGRHERRA